MCIKYKLGLLIIISTMLTPLSLPVFHDNALYQIILIAGFPISLCGVFLIYAGFSQDRLNDLDIKIDNLQYELVNLNP